MISCRPRPAPIVAAATRSRRRSATRQPPLTCLVASTVGSTAPVQSRDLVAGRPCAASSGTPRPRARRLQVGLGARSAERARGDARATSLLADQRVRRRRPRRGRRRARRRRPGRAARRRRGRRGRRSRRAARSSSSPRRARRGVRSVIGCSSRRVGCAGRPARGARARGRPRASCRARRRRRRRQVVDDAQPDRLALALGQVGERLVEARRATPPPARRRPARQLEPEPLGRPCARARACARRRAARGARSRTATARRSRRPRRGSARARARPARTSRRSGRARRRRRPCGARGSRGRGPRSGRRACGTRPRRCGRRRAARRRWVVIAGYMPPPAPWRYAPVRSRGRRDRSPRSRVASSADGQRVEPPLPGPRRRSRLVHARLAPQPEHVLRLHHRHPRAGGERERDQVPPRLLGDAGAVGVDARARRRRQRLVPAAQRVVVVRARVGDPVLGVVGDVVHVVRRAADPAELEHDHARAGRGRRAAAAPAG